MQMFPGQVLGAGQAQPFTPQPPPIAQPVCSAQLQAASETGGLQAQEGHLQGFGGSACKQYNNVQLTAQYRLA